MQRLLLIGVFLFRPDCVMTAQSNPGGDAVPPEKAATIWFCDPVNGSTPTSAKETGKGDGSKERPWGSFESVVKARLVNGVDSTKGKIHAGDTIKLTNGNHGRVSFQSPEYQNTADITVEAAEGESPVVESVIGKGFTKWIFRNIRFRPPSRALAGFILFRAVDSVDISIESCDFRSVDDVSDWGAEDWVTKVPKWGIWVSGTNIRITNNTLYAVDNGIFISGDNIKVEGNSTQCFTNDGMQINASNSLIANNRIVDHYEPPGDGHHDAIQCYDHSGKVMENLTIRDNYIAASTGTIEAIPAWGNGVDIVQGIGIFDGKWRNVQVINNIVCTSAYNGITLMGAQDSVISNNTVINQSKLTARIVFRDSKDGTPTVGCVCNNNIAPLYILPATGVSAKNNFCFEKPQKAWGLMDFTVIDPAKTFVQYKPAQAKFDLTVKDNSPAAGRASRVDRAGAKQ